MNRNNPIIILTDEEDDSMSESLEEWHEPPVDIDLVDDDDDDDDDDAPPTQPTQPSQNRNRDAEEEFNLYPSNIDAPADPTSLASSLLYVRELYRRYAIARMRANDATHVQRHRVLVEALSALRYAKARDVAMASIDAFEEGNGGDTDMPLPGNTGWMPAAEHEPPQQYAARLRDQSMSVVDFLYVLCSDAVIEWTGNMMNANQTSMAVLRDLRALDADTFRIGTLVGARARRYDIELLRPLLGAFMVVNARDAGRVVQHPQHYGPEGAREPWVGALLRVLCNHTPGTDPDGELHLTRAGPEVVWLGAPKNYGLRALRRYNKGELITHYGGRVLSMDPMSEYDNDEDRVRMCSAYGVPLLEAWEQHDALARNWDPIVDGELCWRLCETGRFANQADRPEDENAHFVIVKPPAPHTGAGVVPVVNPAAPRDPPAMVYTPDRAMQERSFLTRFVVLCAKRKILDGEPICVDYGRDFLRRHMPHTRVTRDYDALFGDPAEGVGTCISCGVAASSVECGHCGVVMYCGSHCAVVHWPQHGGNE